MLNPYRTVPYVAALCLMSLACSEAPEGSFAGDAGTDDGAVNQPDRDTNVDVSDAGDVGASAPDTSHTEDTEDTGPTGFQVVLAPTGMSGAAARLMFEASN